MNADRKQAKKGLAFLSPWVIGFLLFTLLPVVLSFYYSLCDYSLLQKPAYIGAENYKTLVHDKIFWQSLGNTMYFAAIVLPAGLMVSLGLAMLLNVQVPGQFIWRTVIFVPSLVPVVASAVVWTWMLNARIGFVNALLGWFGIEGPGWLVNPNWAMPSVALVSIWGCGNAVVIYLAGLQDVPRELYEAAEIDGANVLHRMWHVTIPMLSPVIFFNLVMAIIGTLQVFDLPYVLWPPPNTGGPARSTYFLAMYLYDQAFSYLHMGYASAMAWIMLLIVLALTGIAFWTSSRWVYYQGK